MAVPRAGVIGSTRLLLAILPDALVEDLVRRAWSDPAPKVLLEPLQGNPRRYAALKRVAGFLIQVPKSIDL
jgi:hypothetical protein